MKTTIRALVEAGEIVVPTGLRERPVDGEGRETLLAFGETELAVSDAALPLRAYLGGGSQLQVILIPQPGGEVDLEGGRELAELRSATRGLDILRHAVTLRLACA